MFDHSKTLTIRCTAVELRWVNPHVSLLVKGIVDGNNEEDDDFFRVREYRLAGYRIHYKEFERLTERLPRVVDGFGVKYEPINSALHLRTRPSAPHERAAEAVKDAVLEWQRDPNNPGQPGNTLDSEGGTSKPPSFSQLLTNFDRLPLQ